MGHEFQQNLQVAEKVYVRILNYLQKMLSTNEGATEDLIFKHEYVPASRYCFYKFLRSKLMI